MIEKLKEMVARYQEVERLVCDAEVVRNPARMKSLMKERAQLLKFSTRAEELDKIRSDKDSAKGLLAEAKDDRETRKMAEEEIAALEVREQALLKEIENLFLSEDKEGMKNAIFEIRPGVGGDEAKLWAGDLYRMYARFAERHNWKIEVMDLDESAQGGIARVTFKLEGEDAYRHLRNESGTHRVQRVPATEAAGRIHTSTATVAVLPEAEEVDIQIAPQDLDEKFVRSQGPGGQNVNKVSSAVMLTYKPTGLQIFCQTERSQHANREHAMTILRTKLYEAEVDKRKNERDELRRTQIGTGERAEKIRSYNYPQSRITDHRVEFSVHNLVEVLDGALDLLIGRLLEVEREKKLKALSLQKKPPPSPAEGAAPVKK